MILKNTAYGFKTGPEDIEEAEAADAADFNLEDLDSEDADNEALLTDEEEELLGSLEETVSETENDESADDDISFDDISDMTLPEAETENDIIDENSFDDISAEDTEFLSKPSEDFSDLDALEADLSEVESSVNDSMVNLSDTISSEDIEEDSSRSILLKIEEELLSIKEDLSELKNELSSLKTTDKTPQEPAGEDLTGFFEDDEDETIAADPEMSLITFLILQI